MSCSEAKKYSLLINKVLDDEANKRERDLLNKHMAHCESCRKHFMELKESIETLNHLINPQLSDRFTKNVLEQIPADTHHTIRKWTAKHPVLATMAVCAVPMSLVVYAAGRQSSSLAKMPNEKGIVLVKLPDRQV